MLKLTRHKIGDQTYEMRTPDGDAVAIVAKTGTHLDDYPWEFYPLDGWEYAYRVKPQESMRNAVDLLSHYLVKKAV